MIHRAKLFKNGGSQAVRLPKEFRFEGEEILIRKEGDALILEPVERGWSKRFLKTFGTPRKVPPLLPPREQPEKAEERDFKF